MEFARRAVMLKISENGELSVICNGEIGAGHRISSGRGRQVINPEHRKLARPDFAKRTKPKKKASVHIPKHMNSSQVEMRPLSVYEYVSNISGDAK
jgi:hypothetical protein